MNQYFMLLAINANQWQLQLQLCLQLYVPGALTSRVSQMILACQPLQAMTLMGWKECMNQPGSNTYIKIIPLSSRPTAKNSLVHIALSGIEMEVTRTLMWSWIPASQIQLGKVTFWTTLTMLLRGFRDL